MWRSSGMEFWDSLEDHLPIRTVSSYANVGNSMSVDVPYARSHNLQQMTVWVAEVERFTSIFPCLPQLNRDALFLQPAFPSGQIRTSNPKGDVNCTFRVRIGSSAFLEQQQHAAITSPHWAKARLVVQGFTGFERLKAEYSAIEFSGASQTLDVQGCLQNPIYSRRHSADITHVVFLYRAEEEDHDLTT